MSTSDRGDDGGPPDRHQHVSPVPGFDHRCLPGDIRLVEARSSMRSWLSMYAPATDHDAALLIATELLTNARDASEPDEFVRLRVACDDRGLEITVENNGVAFAPSGRMPGPTSTRGRGLPIVDGLASSLHVDQIGDVVRVCARLDG